MAKFVEALTNFKAGVLSKKLYGRTDINEYKDGLSIGDNAFLAKQGGAYKRFSSLPIMQMGPDTTVQIESFVTSTDQTIFVVGDGFSVYLFNSRGHQFAGPYTMAGDPQQYSMAMVDDVIYITHYNGLNRPIALKIVESAIGVLSVEFSQFGVGMFARPMSSPNTDTALTLQVLAVAGGGSQIQTNGWDLNDYFVIGDIVMITGRCQVQNADRISTGAYLINSFSSTTVANVSPYAIYTDGATTYDALANLEYIPGTGYQIPAASPNSNLFDEWSYTVWGVNRGWPRIFAVDEGRLIAGGTTEFPSTIWGSRTNNPTFFLDRRFTMIEGTFAIGQDNFNFKTNSVYQGDILETDPYNFTLSTKKGSQITMMESSTVFLVGTTRQEFIVTGDGAAISQKNISVRPHTSHGSMILNSLTFDNAVLFVARNRRQIHIFKYNATNGSYITQEVSILNEDEFEEDSIKSMTWLEQLGIAFIVTESGRLASLTLGEDTGTKGFTFHDIGGNVIDLASGYEDEEDYVALIVERNGRTYLEKLSRTTVLTGGTAGSSLDYSRLAESEINYLDGGAVLDFAVSDTSTLGIVGSPRFVSIANNFIQLNAADLKIGDTIVFRSNQTDADIWPGVGPLLNTTYWIIPYEGGFTSGVQLATSLANAQSGTEITFLTGNFYIRTDATLYYEITRDNTSIPTRQFPSGTTLNLYRRSGGSTVEEIVTTDGNDTLNIGADYTGQAVSYGINYKFDIATMPIVAGPQWGSAQLGSTRVDRVTVRTYETKSFEISTDGYNTEEITEDEATSTRYQLPLTADNEFDQVVRIQNNKPEACFIVGLVMRGVSNDG